MFIDIGITINNAVLNNASTVSTKNFLKKNVVAQLHEPFT